MSTKWAGNQKFKQEKLAKTRGRRQELQRGKDLADLRERNRRNDLNPDLQVRQVAIDTLRPSPHRTRRTSPEQVDRVAVCIAELGFSQPILIREDQIVDGHVRVEAARALGLATVPAIDCAHLSTEDTRRLALAINRIAELGEWDLDLLKIEFEDLIDLDVDLGVTGFTSQERDIILLDPLEDSTGSDEEQDEPPVRPVTRRGDIWQLNNHRILCGDALDAESYAALLEGELADAVLMDPPYNVPITGNVSGLGKKVHKEFVMASGEMTDEQFQKFLDQVLERVASCLVAGGVLFIFMDWRSIKRLYEAGSTAKLKLLNLAVWYKEAGAMGALYRSAHELVAVFCKGDKPHTNNVELGRHGRDRSNVWVAPGANRRGSSANEMLALHATPKPVELCADALLDVTAAGDTVLDAFLGSGTTLIAAERTGRRCCGIELEPGFVDVTIERWQRLTGRKAVHAATGFSFDELAEQRRSEAGDANPDRDAC